MTGFKRHFSLPLRFKRSLLQDFFLLVFSLGYGLFLQYLPFEAFLDRDRYLVYAQSSDIIFDRYVLGGPLSVLTNEPLWLYLNMFIGQVAEPKPVVRTVIFIGASLFSYALLRANRRNVFWLILFLFSPQIIKNYTTHLRQGMAIAVFFSGYFSSTRATRWTLMSLSPFIHSSFFVVLPLITVPVLLERIQLRANVRITVLAGVTAILSLSLGFVAHSVGVRQGLHLDAVEVSGSGLGFFLWSSILMLFFIAGRSFLRSHIEATCVLLFYLVSYYFLPVSARIFESAMPIVLLAGLELNRPLRLTFVGTYLTYSIINWYYRML